VTYVQELELARHELFLKDRDLEMLTLKADCASQLQEQVSFTHVDGISSDSNLKHSLLKQHSTDLITTGVSELN